MLFSYTGVPRGRVDVGGSNGLAVLCLVAALCAGWVVILNILCCNSFNSVPTVRVVVGLLLETAGLAESNPL